MEHKQPKVAVDIIIEVGDGNPIKIVMIKRKNPPYGWALPGGFVDYGESLESAAFREAKEETNLDIGEIKQFHTYSEPSRDPRGHTISTVFTAGMALGLGKMKAKDDAVAIDMFSEKQIINMEKIAFDHREILRDYFRSKENR